MTAFLHVQVAACNFYVRIIIENFIEIDESLAMATLYTTFIISRQAIIQAMFKSMSSGDHFYSCHDLKFQHSAIREMLLLALE